MNPSSLGQRSAIALATWFGCGYFPVGPGTVGSVAALAIGVLLNQWLGADPWMFAVLAAVLTAPGVWAATVTANVSGRKDPGIVVIDEVLGQWLTIAGATSLNWKSWLGALALFRLFDIWKPYPVRRLEAIPGGAGIVADDLMAGVYGALVLYIAGWSNLY
jgi:phosphatidylglycerophosphatase A